MYSDEESEEDRGVFEGSLDLKIQIVLMAIMSTIFGVVVVIVLPFLSNEKDFFVSLVFAALLAITSVLFGASVVWGYAKARVGADARRHAEEMVRGRLEGGGEGVDRRYYEDLLAKERKYLVDQLNQEKQAYVDRLRQAFEARIEEEETAYIDELRREFELQLEREKRDYYEQVRRDFESRREGGKTVDVERIREELKRQLERTRGVDSDQIREEMRQQVEKEKREYFEQVKRDFEKKREEERRDYIKTIREEFERKLERDKEAHVREMRAQIEDEFAREHDAKVREAAADVQRRFEEDHEARIRDLKSEFEKRLEDDRNAYLESVKGDFEMWKKDFQDSFRREMTREAKPAPLGEVETKPTPASPEAREAMQYSRTTRSKQFDFASMRNMEKIDGAVELLQESKDYSKTVALVNKKARKAVYVKVKGNREIILEAETGQIGIKARLRLRDFCAGNRLPMEKNDEYVRIGFGSDQDDIKRNLREVVELAFEEPIDAMNLDTRVDYT